MMIIIVHDYRDRRTFVGAALTRMPTRFGIADHEIGRLSQRQVWPGECTQADLDWTTSFIFIGSNYVCPTDHWTTRFSLTVSNSASPTGDIQKNTGTKCGWPYSVYSNDQRACWLDMYIVYCIFFCTFSRFASRLAWHFLWGLPTCSSRFGDTLRL